VKTKQWSIVILTAVLFAFTVLAVQAQGGSGEFNYRVYLPLIFKPSPYPYPLCFGEADDWDGERQYATDGGNDVVSQEMPVGITYPTTCIGWIHRDDTLFVPYPDADFWHLGVPAEDVGGQAKVTVEGLPDGVYLNWSYCYGDCAVDFEWVEDDPWTGVRSITIPLLPEGGVIGIQPQWDDQFDNDHYYTMTVEKVQ